MKTKLPKEYSNLPEYNYDVKLKNGLYYTISPKLQKLNCKNYSIKPEDEVTISAIGKFAIITIVAIGRTKVQYLVKTGFNIKELDSIPERNLPSDYNQYIILALESIQMYNQLVH
ncbi:hypothetical protein [uncultured Salegentibacter sp.]|uniref:hypothetical protein n=1 Tax=uncultured Salegentibacter sp. TaxID=259320 RepID=UPI00259AD770|nr:hypothetical protein [uncultured Salegentibacter sp.]